MSNRAWLSVSRLTAGLQRLLGGEVGAGAAGWRSWLIDAVRITLAVVRDLAEGQLTLRAMSLVYTTLLSLVPLLAISFSVLKGFGVHNQIEPLLLNLLAPLGEKGIEISRRIVGFVEKVEVGVLGFVGIALLFYTVVSLMQKIERAFNFIWHVARERSFIQRFRDYLVVIIVGPVMVFASLGITAALMSTAVVREVTAIESVGAVIGIGATLIPYLLIAAAFSFIYVFIPNTRVQARSALVGGLVAGLLWHVLGWGFASFVASSVKYDAIYSTFATLILFLIWLHVGWLIMLTGGSISFYHQHPDYIATPRGQLRLSARYREKLALAVAHVVAHGFYSGTGPDNVEDMASRLKAPGEAIESILDALETAGFVVRNDGEPPGYLPGRPPESILIKDLLDAVRSADERPHVDFAKLPREPAIDEVLEILDRAADGALDGRTLKDLALASARHESPTAKPIRSLP